MLKTNQNEMSSKKISNEKSIEEKIYELENKLIYSDNYDFRNIFELLENSELNNNNNENLLEKINSIKFLTSSELMISFLKMKLSSFETDYELTKIDKFFGENFRTRLIKKLINSNFELYQIDGNLSAQLIFYINAFFDFTKSIDLNKFPKNWNIYYYIFMDFREKLKEYINNNLSRFKIQEKDTIHILTNIKTILNFEQKINDILENLELDKKIPIEKSLIILFENHLTYFTENLINELSTLTNNSIKEIEVKIFVPPDIKNTQNASLKLNPDDITINFIENLKKIGENTNKYSIGKTYSIILKEILIKIRYYCDELKNKYINERKKIQSYKSSTEYTLFNIIYNIEFCYQSVNNIEFNIGKLQKKYIPTQEFETSKLQLDKFKSLCFKIWTNEIYSMMSVDFNIICDLKYDEKHSKILEDKINEYSTSISSKYMLACKRCHKYLPIELSQNMCENLSYTLIDIVISHLTKLKNVHWTCSSYLDSIVFTLFETIFKALDSSLLNQNKEIEIDNKKIPIKSHLSTKITDIRTILNAISIENNSYDILKHNKIFSQGFFIEYNTMLQIKGCITVTNIHRVTVNVVGDSASNVASNVVGGGLNIVDKLTKFVTGQNNQNNQNN